jgi:hypothetical protein
MTFGNVEQNFDEEGIRAEERNKVLDELAVFLDSADNTSDSGNAQKWVSLPVLFEWMQSKGWNP